jgi:hypothetical protein
LVVNSCICGSKFVENTNPPFPQRVVVGSSIDNLIQILMQALMHEIGPTKYLIGKRFMTFGANRVSIL